MKPRLCAVFAILSLVPVIAPSAGAVEGGSRYQEVYSLVRTHVPGVGEGDLDQAALDGILRAFDSKLSLTTNGTSALVSGEPRPLISQTNLFDGGIAYIRVGGWRAGLAAGIRDASLELGATNRLKGLILDLRYTDGADYAVAVAVADLFVSGAQPLLDWGAGMVASHEKTNAMRLPVAVLINAGTSRAPEALAALLRETGAGMIFWSRTAGRAMVTEEYALKSGGQLSIATAPVKLGDGTPMPALGVQPDVEVPVRAAEERMYYTNAFVEPRQASAQPGMAAAAEASNSATNPIPRRPRINEAQLVRERREGMESAPDGEAARGKPPERAVAVVTDPALSRALDVLKGLAVIRSDRP
jgi:hypothetical protein